MTLFTRFCHDGPLNVFKIGDTEIWGGSRDEALSTYDWTLMVSCAGNDPMFVPKPCVSMSDAAKKLLPPALVEWVLPPFVALGWPDQGIPTLSKSWWLELVQALPALGGAVIFYCHGGHGRTGTALTIIAALSGQIPKDECPLEWLRAVYCDEAVEADDQVDYIEHITGRKIVTEVALPPPPLPKGTTGVQPQHGHIDHTGKWVGDNRDDYFKDWTGV